MDAPSEGVESPPDVSSKRYRWSPLLFALILVALVGGAFWLKTRPQAPAQPAATGQEELMRAGLSALAGGQPAVAVDSFRKVLALNPSHYGATFQLAVALDRVGDPGEARAYWEKVLAMAEAAKDEDTLVTIRARLQRPMTPAEQQAVAMKAGLDALYGRRDPKAAAVEFRKVLAMNPSHYGATYQLASALDQAGKPAEARRFWETALKMAETYRDHPTIVAARARLARNP